MEHLLDSISIIGATEVDGETMDVCAEVVANYNPGKEILTVHLDSFLRCTRVTGNKARAVAAWLPKPEVMEESVARDEASDLARDVARSWRKQVMECIPARVFH
jgi:hypothetical protein